MKPRIVTTYKDDKYMYIGQIGLYAILVRDTIYQPYICAYCFDEVSATWQQGHYYYDLEEAVIWALTHTNERRQELYDILSTFEDD